MIKVAEPLVEDASAVVEVAATKITAAIMVMAARAKDVAH
jgi:hypothetical protein